MIVSRCSKLTVFVPSETDVFVMISQPLAVRNEQTGQPAAGNPVEPEVVADQGVSGPVRCGNTRRFELATPSGVFFGARPRPFDVRKIEVSKRTWAPILVELRRRFMKQGNLVWREMKEVNGAL